MNICALAGVACVALGISSTALADVRVLLRATDTPVGTGFQQLTENRPLAHSLSLTNGGTFAFAAGDLRSGILRTEAISRTISSPANGTSLAVTQVEIIDTLTFAAGSTGTAYFDWGFDGTINVDPNHPYNPNQPTLAFLNASITPGSATVPIFSARLATASREALNKGLIQ